MTVSMTKREEAESAERVARMGSVGGSGSPYSREKGAGCVVRASGR